MSSTRILRHVTAAHRQAAGVCLEIDAFEAVAVQRMPGWLTGEPPADQGIETTMPNLPELELPDPTPVGYRLQITAVAEDTVRITAAAPGHRVLTDDGSWLGIVTEPAPESVASDIVIDDDRVLVSTELLTVTVHRRPFAIRILDRSTGREVLRTAETLRQVAGFPIAPAVHFDGDTTTLNLELAPGERILGFGEQFGPLVKNGQRLRLRVEDALGTGTGLAYKPVPVWHSTTGYTGFLNTGAAVVADVGHSRPSVLSLSAPDDMLDAYLVVGPSPSRRLASYTALTGRGYVPGPWAFGLWMGRCRYQNAEQMLEVARTMREHAVPCDVLHCDPDWLILDRLNADFLWNTERFGDRAEFIKLLAAEGVRLSLWELPYLDPLSSRYAEAAERGFLAVDDRGEPVTIEKTPTPDGRRRGLVDFFNPDARLWWQSLHSDFLDDGVAVFKTDFGEALPDTVVPSDGLPSQHAHNLFTLRYNATVSELVRSRTGGDSLVWGRSGWAGSQRYPGQWGGDAESTVPGMQSTLRGGISYALSAPGLWSHDIGGFFGSELTPALYVRWTQFGALSPLMRAHGLRPREPWEFGDRALAICREWIRLRYSLLPYLWQAAHSVVQGMPMLRPLALEFPADPVAVGIDDQFLLGSELLVVPVFDAGEQPVHRSFYTPAGRWTDLLTEEVFTGPGYHDVLVPLEHQMVLVRDGAVLPRIDLDALDAPLRNSGQLLQMPWTLHCYGAAANDGEFIGFDRRVRPWPLPADRVVRHG